MGKNKSLWGTLCGLWKNTLRHPTRVILLFVGCFVLFAFPSLLFPRIVCWPFVVRLFELDLSKLPCLQIVGLSFMDLYTALTIFEGLYLWRNISDKENIEEKIEKYKKRIKDANLKAANLEAANREAANLEATNRKAAERDEKELYSAARDLTEVMDSLTSYHRCLDHLTRLSRCSIPIVVALTFLVVLQPAIAAVVNINKDTLQWGHSIQLFFNALALTYISYKTYFLIKSWQKHKELEELSSSKDDNMMNSNVIKEKVTPVTY